MTSEWLGALIEATLATSAAVLIALALRRPLRTGVGARIAYGLWGLVPAALLATLLPAPQQAVQWQVLAQAAPGTILPDPTTTMASAPAFDATVVVLLWLTGAVTAAICVGRRQQALLRRLRPLLARADGTYLSAAADGPMLVGSWRPRVVLPLAFERDYPPEQQALMLAHERTHRARGDAHANALATLLCCAFWFNPLLWMALRYFRFDQELACDASVMAECPQARRAYAQAMLTTQLAEQGLRVPLGCQWPAGHPLKERITMLTQPQPTATRRRFGSLLLLALTLTLSFAVWATQTASTAAGSTEAHLFDVRVLLSTPGAEPLMPRMIVREGERAGFKSGNGIDEIAVDFEVRLNAHGLIDVATEMRAGGAVVGKPAIRMQPGEPGTIALDDRAGAKFELTLWVSEHREPVSAAPATPGAANSPRLPDVMPAPRYPADALAAGIEGDVLLNLRVDANGIVREVRVAQAEPAGVFEQSAIAAARGWWLNPQGQAPGALPGWVRTPVKFRTRE